MKYETAACRIHVSTEGLVAIMEPEFVPVFVLHHTRN